MRRLPRPCARPARGLSALAMLFTFLSLLALPAGCCRPRPGDGCRKGQAACLDRRTELSCQSGKFVAAPCRGPGGCVLSGGLVSCDISANEVGDVCSTDDDGKAACSADQGSRVHCLAGVYQRLPCRGPLGCRSDGGGVLCDTSVALPGDACDTPPPGKDNHACSIDGASVLACRDGRFVPEQPCRGPDGCKVKSGVPICDMSIAEAGDACGAEIAGKHACSGDLRSVLRCQSGRFALDRACRGPRGCVLEGERVVCD